MKLLKQNFTMNDYLPGKQSHIILLIVVLFFSEIVLQLIGRPLPQDSSYKFYLIISFGFLLIIFSSTFLMKSANKIPLNFLLIILYTILSFLVGFLNGWNFTDILGDAGRFIAPLLAYFVGKNLYARLSYAELKYTTSLILKGLILLFLFNFSLKLYKLFILEQPLIQYPDGAVGVPVLLIAFFFISWFHINATIRYSCLVIILLTVFILDPIMSASRSLILIVTLFFIVTPLLYGKFRNGLLSLICVFIFGPIILNSELGLLLMNRLLDSQSIFFENGFGSDMSTKARVEELNAAIEGLNNSWFSPISYLIGNGSGALWYADIDLESGLNAANFRSDGGAHHIHIEMVSLLFRHGIIGLGIYLIWIVSTCYKAHKVSRFFLKNDIFIMSISATIVIVLLLSLLEMMSNASIYGHFFIPLISAMPVVLYDRLTSYKNNF